MSEFYKYNPYLEAAAIGGELARGIGEQLVNRPREQYLVAHGQMQDAMEIQRFRQEQEQNAVMNPLRVSMAQAQLYNEQMQPSYQAQRLDDAQQRMVLAEQINKARINEAQARAELAQSKASVVPTVSPQQQKSSWDFMANTAVPLMATRAGVPTDPKTKDFTYPVDGSQAYGYGAGLLNQGVPVEEVMNQLEAVPSLQTNKTFWTRSPYVTTNGMTIRPKPGAPTSLPAQPKNGSSTQGTQPRFVNAPAVGTIYKGHKYLGGNPASPDSWLLVE